jgi:site-specific DNA-cytosine methylase
MRFGSVCSGIEAASVAFSDFGWKAAWLSEVDVPASEVLAHRYGATAPLNPAENTQKRIAKSSSLWGSSVQNLGDMTKIPQLLREGVAEAPDVLCGGTPCQSYSIAGRRKGLDDERGQLTLKFVEIADEIDRVRDDRGEDPCVIFWENVPGVLTDKGNAFGNFLADLAGDDEAYEPGPRPQPGRSTAHWAWKKDSGQHVPKWSVAGVAVGPKRTVAWRVLDAQYFGLAQRRARVFVVASAAVGVHPEEILLEFDGLRRDSEPSREAGENFARSPEQCSFARRDWHDGLHPTLLQSFNTGGIGQSNQELFSQNGGGLVAAGGLEPPEAFRLLAFGHYLPDTKSSTIQARDHKYVTDVVVHQEQTDVLAFDTTQCTSPSNYSVPKNEGPCHPLAATAHPPAVGYSIPMPHKEVCGALTDGAKNGGGLNGQDVYTGRVFATSEQSFCFTSKDHGQDATVDLAPTMRAMAHSTSHANGGGQLAVTGEAVSCEDQGAPSSAAVRRLLPVECERLQGFPDGYTLVPSARGDAADGPRYKQLGNSWAVNVVRWIGGRIDAQLGGGSQTITLSTEDYVWLTAA